MTIEQEDPPFDTGPTAELPASAQAPAVVASGEVAKPESATSKAVALVQSHLQTLDRIEENLPDLRTAYANTVYDVRTTKGMEEATQARHTIRQARYLAKNSADAAKVPMNELKAAVASRAEALIAEHRKLEDPIDEQIKAEEQRKADEKKAREEAARIERERVAAAVQALRDAAIGKTTVADIEAALAQLEGTEITLDTYGERTGEAQVALQQSIASLQIALAGAKALAEQQAEIERQRRELEERQRAEDERRAKEEAEAKRAEQERLEQQRKDQEAQAAAQAEEARKLREQQAALDAERAELQRQKDELAAERQRQLDAQAAREAEEAEKKRLEEEASKPIYIPAQHDLARELTQLSDEDRAALAGDMARTPLIAGELGEIEGGFRVITEEPPITNFAAQAQAAVPGFNAFFGAVDQMLDKAEAASAGNEAEAEERVQAELVMGLAALMGQFRTQVEDWEAVLLLTVAGSPVTNETIAAFSKQSIVVLDLINDIREEMQCLHKARK